MQRARSQHRCTCSNSRKHCPLVAKDQVQRGRIFAYSWRQVINKVLGGPVIFLLIALVTVQGGQHYTASIQIAYLCCRNLEAMLLWIRFLPLTNTKG